MAKFMSRKQGPELLRKILQAWKTEAFFARVEKTEVREEETLGVNISVSSLQFQRMIIPAHKFSYLYSSASAQARHAKEMKSQEAALTAQLNGDMGSMTDRITELESLLEGERRLRVQLEEDMRQAFMRGVTALNLEAITLLKRGVPHMTHNLPVPYGSVPAAAAAAPAAPAGPVFARGAVTASEISRMSAQDISQLVSSALGGSGVPQPRVGGAPTPYVSSV